MVMWHHHFETKYFPSPVFQMLAKENQEWLEGGVAFPPEFLDSLPAWSNLSNL